MATLGFDMAEELVVEGLLNLTPPCGYQHHGHWGEGPAVWIVWVKAPMVCGCVAPRQATALCDPCLSGLERAPLVECCGCGDCKPFRDNLLKIERI